MPRIQFPVLFQPIVTGAAPETITLDKWFAPPSQPVRPNRRPQPDSSAYVLSTTPETVTADRWAQPPSQPTRQPVRRPLDQPVGPLAPLAAPEVVTLDKWFAPPTQPVGPKPRPQPNSSAYVLSTSPATVPADRWAQPPSQPVLPKPRQLPSGSAFVLGTSPTAVSVDQWLIPLSQPVAAKPRQLLTYQVGPQSTLAETITADKWLPQTNQPIRLPRQPQHLQPVWSTTTPAVVSAPPGLTYIVAASNPSPGASRQVAIGAGISLTYGIAAAPLGRALITWVD